MTARSLLITAGCAAGLGLTACQGCRSATPAWGQHPSEPEIGPPTLRLYLLTDLAGALEPCGCTKDQLGGLDHFGSWVRHEHAHAAAAAVVSAGPLFFMDEKLEGERSAQDRIKAETIARVLGGLNFAAFAPGVNDWADGAGGLTKLASTSGAAVVGDSKTSAVFAREVVRDLGGVKVGFVGVGQLPADMPGPNVEETVRRGVEEAKQNGATVLVALAAVGRGEAKRIADAVPDLTAVLVGAPKAKGDGNTTAPQPERVGNVLVIQAANHLQNVAVLDLYVREPNVAGQMIRFADATGVDLAQKREDLTARIDELHVKIAGWERDPSVAPTDVDARKRELQSLEAERAAADIAPSPARGSFFRFAVKEMRESLGKDPAIEADLLGYYRAVDDHNRVAFAERLPPPVASDQASFIGKEACASCHEAARAVWNATAHSHAYVSLSSQYKEFNLECVGCHVTGYERPGGSTVTHVEKLRDVQCEVCHGPGSKHATNPADPAAIIARPQPSRCLECHHSPHVENFDPSIKMREILGPGHGIPLNR